MGWELKVDRDGNEYGIPCRMPRQQVGLWLTKKREEDGGRRFSVQPPARVAATPQYECFIGSCRKRVYERVWLIQHIRVNHPVEAGAYTEFITQLEKSIAADNPRMRQLVEDIINRNDEGLASVPFDGPRLAEQVDTSAGKPIVTHLGIRRAEPEDYACQFEGCGWQPKEDVQKPEVALRQHTYVKHKGEDL